MARRILVVEDSPTQAGLIRLLLEGAGYQVDLAGNGREGLEKVQSSPPDLIISDVLMPVMDGYAFCQAVKASEKTRRIPFVLLTQQNTPQDILRGLTLGADNFIPKPFEDEKLLERVAGIFEHLEYRQKGQLEVEVKLRVGDRELVINPDKQQIVELLFATFDDVCRLNEELRVVGRKLEDYALNLEAKVAERTTVLNRLNRYLRTISLCNQVLVRAADEDELLREVCRTIVEAGGHRAAWVGLVEDGEAPRLRPAMVVGCEPEQVDRHAMDLADPAWETCPVAMAFRTGTPQVIQDIPGNPPRCPWHDDAVHLGFRSSVSLPLKEGGRTFGILTIYSASLDAFDAEEANLLRELAGDLAYGIQALRTRAAHARAQGEVESLARFPSENPHPVLRVASDGTILYANAPSGPLLRLWGTAVGDRMPGEWRRRIGHVLETRAQEGIDVSCEECIYSVNLAPVPGAGYVNLYGRDITQHMRAELALRQSEEQFRAMFEVASIGMAQADVHTGQWLRVNAKLCAITGYTVEELLRLRVSEITRPEDREQDWQAFARVVRGDAPDYRMEKRYVRKDGTLVWVNVNMTVIRDADGQPLRTMATIEDITDRKRLEQERIELEAQLRQQQKLEAIGTLASGVAHEINNPISGIMNYAQLIADTVEPASQTAEYAKEIVHETERVATIVRNLLQFARQEKQTHSLARPADLVEQTLSLFRAVLRHDQITLTVDVPENLPSLKCRSQQLQQVLMNLLTNARDALNAKYPGHHKDKTIQVSIRPFDQAGRPWLRLTVADQGTGIPPEIQARIFDPFFTTKPRDQGTGLGLSISHGIVKDHQGVLHFETEIGVGTRFHMDLPLDNGWTVEGK
jgi:PAS domain S-box-containing protein